MPGVFLFCKLTPIVIVVALVTALAGCGSQPKIASLDKSDTLKELPKARMPAIEPVSASSIAAVSASYREALALVDDPAASEDIMRRLALLELRQAEQLHLASTLPDPSKIYQNAIHTYETLLAAQHGREDNDVLLYSLAKARELSGDLDGALATHSKLVQEFPRSQYYIESQFRRGELLFSEQRYAKAGAAYAAVIQRQQEQPAADNPFLLNAHYMLGWSNFKLSRYDRAMRSFVVVLDDYHQQQGQQRKNLSDDTYRVMALAFSYRLGSQSIADLLDDVGERQYASELYSRLGELYLDKKRFVDSAEVYGSFIARYPVSAQAPEFQQQKIDAYIAGRFPEKVREGKREFARSYSIGGEYWLAAGTDTRQFIREKMAPYIEELASYHHALAQQYKTDLGNPETTIQLADAQAEFRQAAAWYEEWIRSFPEAEDIAGKYFLSGETRFEAQDFPQAIDAYEMAAYSYPEFADGAESGYAALLAYDRVIESKEVILPQAISAEEVAGEALPIDWSARKIESALLFAEHFSDDARRSPVLGQTVESLLQRQEYPRTIEVASLLLSSESLPAELQLTGYLSTAHAHNALQDYPNAEQGYREALEVMRGNPQMEQYASLYQPVRENYAASIYKQGELANANNEPALAAQQFLRVVNLVPESSIRVTAQHDAGVLLMQTEQWASAINVISDFQQRFPEHESNNSASARLLQANQQLQDWPAAAAQAMAIYQNDADAEARRQALYLAAELYEKAEMAEQAITAYRDYSHSYAAPLAERMEAQFKLVGLYEKQRDNSKRLFWVNQLMKTHDSASSKTDRSVYLASFASAELAAIDMQQYSRLELSHPLKNSLAKKRVAMDKAMVSYQKTHDYGVAEFTTLATQKMGEIYASFATALLESERPKELSELEREQYDMLLEEQAYPFEEEAIGFFSVNIERAWQGTRTAATSESYAALAKLLPAKYNKLEIRPEVLR